MTNKVPDCTPFIALDDRLQHFLQLGGKLIIGVSSTDAKTVTFTLERRINAEWVSITCLVSLAELRQGILPVNIANHRIDGYQPQSLFSAEELATLAPLGRKP
jgi:hypothetical protein